MMDQGDTSFASSSCSKHLGEPIERHCNTCSELLCVKCIVMVGDKHRDHDLVSYRRHLRNSEQEATKLLRQLLAIRGRAENFSSLLSNYKLNFQQSFQEYEDSLDSFQVVKARMTKWKCELIATLEKEKILQVKHIDDAIESVGDEVSGNEIVAVKLPFVFFHLPLKDKLLETVKELTPKSLSQSFAFDNRLSYNVENVFSHSVLTLDSLSRPSSSLTNFSNSTDEQLLSNWPSENSLLSDVMSPTQFAHLHDDRTKFSLPFEEGQPIRKQDQPRFTKDQARFPLPLDTREEGHEKDQPRFLEDRARFPLPLDTREKDQQCLLDSKHNTEFPDTDRHFQTQLNEVTASLPQVVLRNLAETVVPAVSPITEEPQEIDKYYSMIEEEVVPGSINKLDLIHSNFDENQEIYEEPGGVQVEEEIYDDIDLSGSYKQPVSTSGSYQQIEQPYTKQSYSKPQIPLPRLLAAPVVRSQRELVIQPDCTIMDSCFAKSLREHVSLFDVCVTSNGIMVFSDKENNCLRCLLGTEEDSKTITKHFKDNLEPLALAYDSLNQNVIMATNRGLFQVECSTHLSKMKVKKLNRDVMPLSIVCSAVPGSKKKGASLLYMTLWPRLGDNCVYRLDSNGQFESKICSPDFSNKKPFGIDYMKEYLVVSFLDDGSLMKMSHRGDPLWDASVDARKPGILNQPFGIAILPRTEYIAVTEAGAHRVSIFSDQGKLVLRLGEKGSDRGKFYTPHGIAVRMFRELVVVDCGNKRIQIFSLTSLGLPSFRPHSQNLSDDTYDYLSMI